MTHPEKVEKLKGALARLVDEYDAATRKADRLALLPQIRDAEEDIRAAEREILSERAHTRFTLAELQEEARKPQTEWDRWTIEREIACRRALEASPFDLGEEVVIGPGWRMGQHNGDGGRYVREAYTGDRRRVTGFCPDGEIWVDHPRYQSFHPSIVFEPSTMEECECGSWADAHTPHRHAAGCSRK